MHAIKITTRTKCARLPCKRLSFRQHPICMKLAHLLSSFLLGARAQEEIKAMRNHQQSIMGPLILSHEEENHVLCVQSDILATHRAHPLCTHPGLPPAPPLAAQPTALVQGHLVLCLLYVSLSVFLLGFSLPSTELEVYTLQ